MHASSMLKALVAVIAASSSAFAELSVTAPVDGTVCNAGQPCTVSWGDSGTGVSLAQQGLCTVALYTGGAQQQTFLQPIAFPTAVNVATTSSIVFTVDGTVGPNGSDYFIRFSSQNLTQTGSTNPYLSFSHKFTLAGMTGTFNQTVLSQIASASSTTAAAGTTGAATTHAGTTTGATHASTTTHATTTTHSGAGSTAGISGALIAGVAVVAGVAGLF